MSIRGIRYASKRAFRPAFDDLEGRRLLSSSARSAVPQGTDSGDVTPAIADFNNTIYLASITPFLKIQIASSSNGGTTFGNQITLPETTDTSPTLTVFDGRLYIAWKGIGGSQLINVESSSNGVNFGNKVTLPETSEGNPGPIFEHPSPALAGFDGSVYVAWKGREGHLNTEWSTDGVNFGGKVTYPIVSNFGTGPTLASSDGSLYMGWRSGGGKITGYHVQRIAPTALMLRKRSHGNMFKEALGTRWKQESVGRRDRQRLN
jgi:hypothetical protein